MYCHTTLRLCYPVFSTATPLGRTAPTVTWTPNTTSTATVRCNKCIRGNDSHREYATRREVQQCHDSAGALQQPWKVVTAAAISRDVDESHQKQNDGWARSQALRQNCYGHGDAIPRDNCQNRTQRSRTGSPLRDDRSETSTIWYTP